VERFRDDLVYFDFYEPNVPVYPLFRDSSCAYIALHRIRTCADTQTLKGSIIMRSYPRNSPHAAARIAALTLIADGRMKDIELTALERMDAYGRLGMEPVALRGVLHELCTDMLAAAAGGNQEDCRITPETIRALLAEIDDPALRRLVFELCAGVARADRMMHEGELAVLLEAIDHWRMDSDQAPHARSRAAQPDLHASAFG